MNYLDNIGAPDSPIHVTPLKTGKRADWHVSACRETTGLPVPFEQSDIIAQLRKFFDALDAEAELHQDDPIAMVNALARMEAVLADVRSVTATIRRYAADALAEYGVRRMTIDELATVESTSEATRTEWKHVDLLADMLSQQFSDGLVDAGTGELLNNGVLAGLIMAWFRVEWRLTPIREMGLDPDNYSTLPVDEDGKPMRTPTIRIHDNSLRKQQVV